MTIEEVLKEALRIVQLAKVPDELRAIAYAKTIDLLSEELQSSPGPASDLTPERRQRDDARFDGKSYTLVQLAKRLSLPVEVVADVFETDSDGHVELAISTGMLESSNAAAVRQIALLVAGARQLSGHEEWTSAEEMREVCAHFGRYDSNTATYIRSMTDEFRFQGKRSNRQVKLRKPGVERLSELVRTLSGGEP